MHRLYCTPTELTSAVKAGSLILTGREAHHAVDVLRLRIGEEVNVHDGEGRILSCKVRKTARGRIELIIESIAEVPRTEWQIELAQALTKGDAFDWVIEKATELGVHRICPVITRRTVVKIEETAMAAKLERWRQISIAAMKQCGTPWLPSILPAVQFDQLIQQWQERELELIGVLTERTALIKTWFGRFKVQHGRVPRSVRIWIGPEGDFTPQEVQVLIEKGCSPFTLGPNVLRAETAAVCASAIVLQEYLGMSELGDSNSPEGK